jgi:hypothetical protein
MTYKNNDLYFKAKNQNQDKLQSEYQNIIPFRVNELFCHITSKVSFTHQITVWVSLLDSLFEELILVVFQPM